MTQDITQWIAEVRTLQHQLADARRERDQAYNSAANWRRLYENEARQRRQEAEQLEAQIKVLRATSPAESSVSSGLHQEASSCHPVTQEQIKVLTQQLEAERQAHTQTRQSLTAALGDTFDILKLDAPTTSSAGLETTSRR
ncbi:MAG: hypothetical protein HC929_05035 [Leptolyngbyaceae cyanobacterium SM2_5_2]|nr:hypothetical protein [Leptolyngbyaceae cyanobacterium SM2_5_2]